MGCLVGSTRSMSWTFRPLSTLSRALDHVLQKSTGNAPTNSRSTHHHSSLKPATGLAGHGAETVARLRSHPFSPKEGDKMKYSANVSSSRRKSRKVQ